MATIEVDYAALSRGHDGLLSTWQRIEAHLAELDHTVAGTHDMRADALVAYQALKARWSESAGERQLVLRSLTDLLGQAGDHYRQADAAMTGQFNG